MIDYIIAGGIISCVVVLLAIYWEVMGLREDMQ